LDVAASEFYDSKTNTYNLSHKVGTTDRVMSPDALLDIYDNLSKNYPIVSIEDPFDQDDFSSYIKMT
jgi:enolase